MSKTTQAIVAAVVVNLSAALIVAWLLRSSPALRRLASLDQA